MRLDGSSKRKPHLFISKEQHIPGIRGCKNFLVVENLSGDREVIVPVRPRNDLGKSIERNAKISSVSAKIRKDKLGKHVPLPQGPEASIYFAYLSLTHAATPEDYRQAMKLLQGARKFVAIYPRRITTSRLDFPLRKNHA